MPLKFLLVVGLIGWGIGGLAGGFVASLVWIVLCLLLRGFLENTVIWFLWGVWFGGFALCL